MRKCQAGLPNVERFGRPCALHVHTCSAGPCIIVSQDDFPSPGCLSRFTRLSSWSVWRKWVALLVPSCVKNATNIPKYRSCGRKVKDTVFGFFLGDVLYAIPRSVFSFRIKMMKLAFVTRHDSVKKYIAFDSIPFQELWRNAFSLKSLLFYQ